MPTMVMPGAGLPNRGARSWRLELDIQMNVIFAMNSFLKISNSNKSVLFAALHVSTVSILLTTITALYADIKILIQYILSNI